jgi:hypothetical protein
VAATTTPAQRAQVQAVATASTVQTTVSLSTEPTFELVEAACSTDACDPPMRGGIGLIRMKPTRALKCTAGFVARNRQGPTFTPYVVTAGHCTKDWREQAPDQTVGMLKDGQSINDINDDVHHLGVPTAKYVYDDSGASGSSASTRRRRTFALSQRRARRILCTRSCTSPRTRTKATPGRTKRTTSVTSSATAGLGARRTTKTLPSASLGASQARSAAG